jgi:hypothetical protein
MMNTAAYSGLRWGEIAALTVVQVDTGNRVIAVDRKVVEIAGQDFGRLTQSPIAPALARGAVPAVAAGEPESEEAGRNASVTWVALLRVMAFRYASASRWPDKRFDLVASWEGVGDPVRTVQSRRVSDRFNPLRPGTSGPPRPFRVSIDAPLKARDQWHSQAVAAQGRSGRWPYWPPSS